MTVFLSTTESAVLDSLSDVTGFTTADAGTAYSLLRDTAGGSYRPVPASDTSVSVAPTGGLEQDAQGRLKIKPDTDSGDSGVGLSADGLEIINRVKKAGDTMTGVLNMSGNLVRGLPTDTPLYTGDEAVSWAQAVELVSESALTRVNKDGDTMDGDLVMEGNRVTTLAEPATPQDAATKNYVDIQNLGASTYLGVARSIATSATSASVNLTATGLSGVRLTAKDAAVRYSVGTVPQTASASSHYLPADTPASFTIGDNTAVAAIQDTGPGVLEISELSVGPPMAAMEYLLVGGGGGGGARSGAGGGGAGGFLSGSVPVVPGLVYSVEVGGGGFGGVGSNPPFAGFKGTNSLLVSSDGGVTLNAVAYGGGGGKLNSTSTNINLGSSGGGGRGETVNPDTLFSPPQGNLGGDGASVGAGGGGGGASAPGADAVGNTAGRGGDGLSSAITGVSVFYAGGGGASALPTVANPIAGVGGLGGGGNGVSVNNTSGFDASANTGGGGGGACGSNNGDVGGRGARGVVIVAYSDSFPELVSTGSFAVDSLTTRPGYRVYRIRFEAGNSGTIEIPA